MKKALQIRKKEKPLILVTHDETILNSNDKKKDMEREKEIIFRNQMKKKRNYYLSIFYLCQKIACL